jgi:hypothetical protein
MRIRRTSWLRVLFLNIWYLTCYIFQGNQCIFHRPVHTVKFVFEKVGSVKFETNLKERFDLHLLWWDLTFIYPRIISLVFIKTQILVGVSFSNSVYEMNFLSNTLNVVPTRIRLYERHWMLNKLINYLQIIPWNDILMF